MWTDAAAGKKVILKSSDGETFEVDEVVALESQTIKHMIEDDCADSAIPLPNVSGKILSKVIEYCKKHVEAPKAEDRVSSGAVDEDLKQWDAEFVRVDLNTLFHFISAANYLNIESLLDLTCQAVADMIKGKTPEEIRKTFNIKSEDYLNIKSLLDRTCQTVADMIKGTTPEEITKTFNIKSEDYLDIKCLLDRTCQTVADMIKGTTPEEITKTFNIKSEDYLNIKSLLDLSCQTVADMIKGKAPEEIWKTFNIKSALVILKSSDGEIFVVDEVVAWELLAIRHMIVDYCVDTAIPFPIRHVIVDYCADTAIPLPNVSGKILLKVIVFPTVSGKIPLKGIELPNVSGKILSKVIEYCKKHVEAPKAEDRVPSGAVDEDLKLWDAEFVKVDQNTLSDLILSADYLNIKSLLDLTCQAFADMIKGKTPEEIKKTFNIKNDFTPEEEEEVRRENQWAFE